MATSGSVDYNATFRTIATQALDLIGAVQGEEPSAEDMDRAQFHCNVMLKTWGTSSRLWLTTEGTVPLVAATATYSVPLAKRVLSVRRRTSSLDTPLTEMSREEYYDFSAKTASGMPYQWYFDAQQSTRTLLIVAVPDATVAATTTLQYTYQRVIEDIDDLDDDFDLPQEWFEAILYGLAARLTVPYRTALSNPAGAAEVKERAATLYAELAADDDEGGSLFLQPA